MSAAELVASFHFYFLGNPEGLAFDAPGLDYDTVIWRPMTAYLRGHGGDVHCGEAAARVAPDGDGWRVTGRSGREWTARHLVLAVDPPALRALVAASPELSDTVPRLAEQVAGFGAGPPYAVARYWLDRDVAPGRPIFSGVSRQPTLDSVTLYHRLEAGARDWARRTGGAVVELHAYACPPGVPAEELGERMRAELTQLWPEATGRPVHVQARVEEQAPSFDMGAADARPAVETDADGLYLAGDGIRADFPSALMERAAATGIMAANRILARSGAATEPVRSIRPRGLLAPRRRAGARD
jgi:isorenieratene synthase